MTNVDVAIIAANRPHPIFIGCSCPVIVITLFSMV